MFLKNLFHSDAYYEKFVFSLPSENFSKIYRYLMSKMNVGKRGPLPSAGPAAPARSLYKCLVTECSAVIRGDRLKTHYSSKVDFKILTQMKGLSSEQALPLLESIGNSDIKAHTKYFFEQKIFSPDATPTYKQHKRPQGELMNPFQRCKLLKGKMKKN